MIVIGAGRIGGALHARAKARGVPSALIDRDRGWEVLDSNTPGPVLLAVRNDDLDAVIQRIPAARHDEMVLIQNGMLRPWIGERGLAVTRGLLFFAVGSRGAAIQPGNPSPFTGPDAVRMVEWLTALGIAAEEVDEMGFREIEAEKLIWNCAFGLLCERFDAPVDQVVTEHDQVLRELVTELLLVASAALGVELAVGPLVDRLAAYSMSISGYQGAVKEWRWRNGWFVDTGRTHGTPTPLHDALLREIGR